VVDLAKKMALCSDENELINVSLKLVERRTFREPNDDAA
jgi:hypothetical protein